MPSPEETTYYFKNIIDELTEDIRKLENERRQYGKIMKFLKGINRNLRDRQLDLLYYMNLLDEYRKNGWAS